MMTVVESVLLVPVFFPSHFLKAILGVGECALARVGYEDTS